MIKIKLMFPRGEESEVRLTEYQAEKELSLFVNGLSDSGKRQWIAKIKKTPTIYPFTKDHYKSKSN